MKNGTTTGRVCVVRGGVLAVALLWAAGCGGAGPSAPSPTATQDGSAAPVAGGERPQERAPEISAEEKQRQAEAATMADFERAGQLWASGRPGARDYAQIERILRSVAERKPDLADVWFNLGVLREEQGDVAGAIELYRKAGEVDDQYARGIAQMGFLKLASGDEAAAEALFQECLARSPIEPGCNINLAVLYRARAMKGSAIDREKASAALERLRFALGGDARNAEAYATMARLYYDMGRLTLARLVCENAVLQGVDSASIHNRLGLVALAEGDANVAYREFQAAVKLDPEYIDAHRNIGAMALSFRDYAAALTSLEKVLARSPNDMDARLSYGVALRGTGDIDGAEREYRAVLSSQSDDARALFNLAVLHQEYRQDYEGAIAWFEKYLAVEKDPKRVADTRKRVETLRTLLELTKDPT